MKFETTFLPAADVNKYYSQTITVTGGTAPYTYTALASTLPPGLLLNFNTGEVYGVPTSTGTFNFVVTATDGSGGGGVSISAVFQFTVMNFTNLSTATVDQSQFVQQFQETLAKSKTWSTGLTTQTSQTLIELVSTVGAFNTAKIVRSREDAFSDTAQSDTAVRAIANMQGLRLSRKLPASVAVRLSSPQNVTIPAFTQFSFAGYSWFNSDAITLVASVQLDVILKEGIVTRTTLTGLGTDLQAWVSVEDGFTVSDQDVSVAVNSAVLLKTYGGLWNYSGLDAFADDTLPDGRLKIQFGSKGYGSVPGVNDVVTITYPVTIGADANGVTTSGSKVSVTGLNYVTGTALANPSGGANEKSPLAYKNFGASTFGTFSSGITKSQYHSLVSNYPGVLDAVVRSQREINPADVFWMNAFRISALTNVSWSPTQIANYISYLESVTMYGSRFVWQPPLAIPITVDITVYCLNSVQSTSEITRLVRQALTNLFSPRPGILLLDMFISDIVETAMNAAPGQISYVVVNQPTKSMIVTAPKSPKCTFVVDNSGGSGGTLTARTYSYAISANAPSPDGSPTTDIGVATNWVFPVVTSSTGKVTLDWSADVVPGATAYKVWGRRGGALGLLATLSGSTTTFVDNGSVPDPTPTQILTVADIPIRYNSLSSLTVNTLYASRQEKASFPVRDTI